MDSVQKFLENLGLDQHFQSFAENEITPEILTSLTSEDLKDLGVSLVGHRRRLLNAIEALSAAATQPPPGERTPPFSQTEAERRQLTILMCDLVGSTALSEQLDAEELSVLIGTYHRKAAEVVAKHDGHLAKYMGDGVLIYFGYPVAGEDDAVRAVRAALDLVEAVAGLTAPDESALSARVGVATGLVVVGELVGAGEATERGVVGDTPNLAARLESHAQPGTVLIASTTRALVEGHFDIVKLPPQPFKGIADQVPVFQAVRETNLRNRFKARHRDSALRLVGRTRELETLKSCWHDATRNKTQLVLVSGEAGIGKSHLAEALLEWVLASGGKAHRYFGSRQHRSTPLVPVIAAFEEAIAPYATPQDPDRAQALAGYLGPDQADLMPALARLLSIRQDAPGAQGTETTSEQKSEMMHAVIETHLRSAAQTPLLIVVEDAQWLDPSSLDLLERLFERLSGNAVMVVMNTRPDFDPVEITGDVALTRLPLAKLQQADAIKVVEEIATSFVLPQELIHEVLRRSDGIPLFVEEMTRSIVESADTKAGPKGPTGLSDLAIPMSLHDSLMARLDRLGPSKEIAQIGAVIGRSFSFDVIKHLVAMPERALADALDTLVSKRLAYRQTRGDEISFTFRHALLRDAAYESLLKSRRQSIHRGIADTFRSHFADFENTQPEAIAHHLTRAGQGREAIQYWSRAGENALRAAAPVEAIAHLKRSLKCAEPFGDLAEITTARIEAWTHLGAAYLMAEGQGAPEVKEAYSTAWDLCQGVKQDQEIFPVLFGLWRYHLMNADLATARAAGQKLKDLAEQAHSPAMNVSAQLSMAVTLFQTSDLEECYAFAEMGNQTMLDNPELRSSNSVFLIGQDPEVACLSAMAMADCLMGRAHRSFQRAHGALAVAERQKHPFHISAAHFWLSLNHMLRSDPEKAATSAENAARCAREGGYPMWLNLARLALDATHCQLAPSRDAVARIRTSVEVLTQQHTTRFLPMAHGLLADACQRVGLVDDAQGALERAFDAIDAYGERWFESELWRLRAILSQDLAQSPEETLAAFREAFAVSRRHKHRLAELNTAVALDRFLRSTGQSAEPAARCIGRVQGWFTEQRDTWMLQHLATCLEENKSTSKGLGHVH